MEKTKEIKFINIARGLAIIMMILGHVNTNNDVTLSFFVNFFLLFHMILFIFISGYLFKDKSFNDFREMRMYLFKRIKKLYLFYLKYELIFYALTNIFFKIGWLTTEPGYYSTTIIPISNLKQVIVDLIKIIIGMGRVPFCGAFWFIISLIFITCGMSFARYLTNRFKNNFIEIFYVIITFVIGSIMSYTISIPRISPALTGTLFFYLGSMSYKFKIKFDKFFLCIASIGVLMLAVLFKYPIAMNSNTIGFNPILFILISLAGIYFTLFISKKIEMFNKNISNLLNYIGKNTLFIMAYHFISFKFVMIVEYLLKLINYENIAILKGNPAVKSGGGIVNILLYTVFVISGLFVPLLFKEFICKIRGVNK